MPAVTGTPPLKPAQESSGAYPAVRTPSAHNWPSVKKNYGGLPSGDMLPAVKVPPAAPETAASESPAPRARRSLAIMALGIVVLLCGALMIVKQAVVADRSVDFPATEHGEMRSAALAQTNGMTVGSAAGSGGWIAVDPAAKALMPVIAHKIRPSEFLDTLELHGAKPQFQPVASLTNLRRPLRVDCLLRARLDDETRQRWKNAGMLADDVLPTSFLLSVRIETDDALQNLYDWHVESVCVRE